MGFVVKSVANENFLRGTEFPACGSGAACIVEQSVWFVTLLGRLSVLGALVWTAFISEYCLVILAVATFSESAWWIFCAAVAGLLLLFSVLLVFQDLIERPVRRFAGRKGLTWVLKYLDFVTSRRKKCARFFFGDAPLDEEPDEGNFRVQTIEASMIRIASMTKNSIVESLEAVERRVKAHASSIGDSIRSQISPAMDGTKT